MATDVMPDVDEADVDMVAVPIKDRVLDAAEMREQALRIAEQLKQYVKEAKKLAGELDSVELRAVQHERRTGEQTMLFPADGTADLRHETRTLDKLRDVAEAARDAYRRFIS